VALHHSPGVTDSTGIVGVATPMDVRLALGALLSTSGVGGDVLPGIIYTSPSAGVVSGSTSGPNMQYNIAAGAFVVRRGTAAQGSDIVVNDGTVTNVSSATPAPGSGSRYDLIWVRQRNAYTGDPWSDATSDPDFGVTVGTASGSPTKPTGSVPAGALVLAESLVGTSIANASLATITMVAPLKVAAGAPVPMRFSADLAALTGYDGLYADHLGLDRLMRYSTTDSRWHAIGGPTVTTVTGLSLVAQSGAPITTLGTQTVADPFGSGVPYRVRLLYQCAVDGSGSGKLGLLSPALTTVVRQSSVLPGTTGVITHDLLMPTGGTVTFSAGVTAWAGGTWTVYADAAAHTLSIDVWPL